MLLVDSTVKPQQLDLDALEFLAENDIPANACSPRRQETEAKEERDAAEHVDMFADEISEMFEELPPFVFTARIVGKGRKSCWIHRDNTEFMKNGGDGRPAFSDED